MNFYRNMKVRNKFLIPVILMIIGFVFVILFTIKTLNSNSKSFANFIDQDQTLLFSLSNMYASIGAGNQKCTAESKG